MVADIEKAFLQIRLQDDAKDVTRFFWLKDRDKLEVENNIQMYRFCRVPFGIISSPFLLAATLDHHLKTCNNDVSESIRKNIYVDNVITGTQSCQEAVQLYNVSKSRNENPQKLTQLSSRSHQRHLVGERTAQKDTIIDTTSDSQVNSNFPNRWSPASLTFNNYFYLFLYLYIT